MEDRPAYNGQPAATSSFGLQHGQEPKYGVNNAGRLFNRATGVEIPDDEPVMVFRAKDRKAVVALQAYFDACSHPDHRVVVKSRIFDFTEFAALHPERMKEPDSNLRETSQANVGRQPFAPATSD